MSKTNNKINLNSLLIVCLQYKEPPINNHNNNSSNNSKNSHRKIRQIIKIH